MSFFKIIRRKKESHKSSEELRKEIEKQKKNHGSPVPQSAKERYNVSEITADGCPCYVLEPKKNFHGEFIFYIYESGLCFPIRKNQWNFILDLAERTGMGLVVPMYPLAPEKCCQDVFDMLIPAYRDFSINPSIEKLSILGEGAGAGLALSLAIQIWKEGYRKPDKIVLLAPALDTEFFDAKLEQEMRSFRGGKLFFSDGIKQFVNQYWVKDYAVRTEFTSPIYEDLTDLCDDILVISGTADMLNCYARSFYDKAIHNGLNVKYFEYKDMSHQFYLDPHYPEAIHARKVMTDVLGDRQDAILNRYMYEIKQRGEWTKKFPEIFKDDLAVKYLCNNRIPYEKYKKQGDYQKLLAAARMHGFDGAVKRFLQMYPNGTVVYLGCSLDTMFQRTDNGRVLWYNCDSPEKIAIRRTYVTDQDREKTINRSLNDANWLDDIRCDMGNGLLFVCLDVFGYLKQQEVQSFIDRLHRKFTGCQVLFDVSSYMAMLGLNRYNRNRELNYRKRRFYMNDVERGVANWNTGYQVIRDDSMLSGIEVENRWKSGVKLRFRYDHYKESYKLVQLRLGTEKYQVEM
jgi:O-methyltransferase involved in polyketide biosynthesis/acetyl esterase/lipase